MKALGLAVISLLLLAGCGHPTVLPTTYVDPTEKTVISHGYSHVQLFDICTRYDTVTGFKAIDSEGNPVFGAVCIDQFGDPPKMRVY